MNSMTRIISRALAVSLLVLVAACSDSSDGILYKDDLPTAAAPEAPAPAPGPGNIVEVATEAGDFPTLLAAVEAAGLVDALSDDSASLTVFAPTEAAFAALPEGALDSLLADPDALAGVLTYHVLSSAVTVNQAADLAGSTVETLNGGKVAITVRDDDYVYINLAQVVSYDIEASNGIIHVIDAVLLPPDLTPSEMTIAEIASSNEDFETLVAAATAANLVGTLNDPEASLTVFAPTDAAFEALGESTLNYLLNNLDDLESTLLYHVVAGAGLSSIDAIAATGSSIEMANGDEAMISLGDSGLMINMSNIVTTDIVASNGIIHVIDTVLDAPSVEAAPLAVTLAANGGFSTLSGLIEDAGLTETLMDPNANVTVFAPTDDAFAQMKRLGVFTKLSGSVTADFTTGAFDGSGAIADAETETYTFPTGAQEWAGFANNADIYPLSFPEGGSITFTASAATPTNVRFRFEANPYPNTEPSYNTENVLVDSAEAKEYTIEIPSQGDQTFNSFLMYVVERDQPVMVTNIVVTSGTVEEPEPESDGSIVFSGVFGGSVVDLETNTYTVPAGSEGWAGFANEDTSVYPFTFAEGGHITFTASAATPTTVRFRFEKAPYPDTEPSFDTATVLIDSDTPKAYSVEFASQGDNTFTSLLMYISEQDSPVVMTDVFVNQGPKPLVFSGVFGGSVVDLETNTYTVPAGSEVWAGFANEDTSLYPFTFTDGGHITFTASAAAPTTVRFRFEKNPYPDTEPSFDTATVLIDSDTPKQYSVQFGSQGENTFSSFLMYISEQDSPVVMTDVSVNQGPIPIVFSGVFGGSVVDLETSTYTVPAGSEGWAGFANEDASVYPFEFANGGSITFTASAAATTTVRFRFEKNPYPDTEPSFDTSTVTIDSDTATEYTVEFGAQGANTFSSFLFYINEQDSPVVMTDVVVTAN